MIRQMRKMHPFEILRIASTGVDSSVDPSLVAARLRFVRLNPEDDPCVIDLFHAASPENIDAFLRTFDEVVQGMYGLGCGKDSFRNRMFAALERSQRVFKENDHRMLSAVRKHWGPRRDANSTPVVVK